MPIGVKYAKNGNSHNVGHNGDYTECLWTSIWWMTLGGYGDRHVGIYVSPDNWRTCYYWHKSYNCCTHRLVILCAHTHWWIQVTKKLGRPDLLVCSQLEKLPWIGIFNVQASRALQSIGRLFFVTVGSCLDCFNFSTVKHNKIFVY